MQSTCPGSGSHSPFLVHIDAFGPVRMNPGGQVYVTDCPSVVGVADFVTMTTPRSCNNCVGGSQATV